MDNKRIEYEFSTEKNQQLIHERGISFEEVIAAIDAGAVLDILPHFNLAKYPNQEFYVLEIKHYVYLVPFVRKNSTAIFLKTIFPHRKLTKRYLGGIPYDKEKA